MCFNSNSKVILETAVGKGQLKVIKKKGRKTFFCKALLVRPSQSDSLGLLLTQQSVEVNETKESSD